jgi:hypothetical protein
LNPIKLVVSLSIKNKRIIKISIGKLKRMKSCFVKSVFIKFLPSCKFIALKLKYKRFKIPLLWRGILTAIIFNDKIL